MNVIDVLSLILSALAVILSCYVKWDNNRDRDLIRAPRIVIENCTYLGGNNYKFPKGQSILPSGNAFTLDRRCFINKTDVAEPDFHPADNSLIINFTKEKCFNDKELLIPTGFEKITLKNIGYDMSSFSIDKIVFCMENEKASPNKYIMSPDGNNKLNMSLPKNCTITIRLSVVGKKGKTYPFDFKKLLSNKFYNDNSSVANNNLINTYFTKGADNWKSIEFYCSAYNIHEEKYTQIVRIFRKNGVYSTQTMRIK